MQSSPRFVWGLAALLASGASAALGQTNADINAGLQFSYIPPGARSLAMGGAFTGLADDATAAWTNPAGLVQLPRPEVSLELREATYTNFYPSAGTIEEPGRGSSRTGTAGVAFASFVWTAASERFSFAVFHHRLADFEAAQSSRSILGDNPTSVDDDVVGRRASLSLDIPGFGVAGAYRITDRLSVGASLISYSYELLSENRGLLISSSHIPDVQRIRGDDDALGGSLGVQWSGDDLRLSAVYRRGPEFDAEYEFICGNGAGFGGARLCEIQQIPTGGTLEVLSGDSSFRAPDSAAIGVAVHATPRLTISADLNRVFYSQYSDQIANIQVFGVGRPDFPRRFTIQDITEIHAGVEYSFPLAGEKALFVRAGSWLEPDHRLRYAAAANNNDDKVEVRFNTLEEEDRTHVTGGLGLTFGSRFQVDLAADLSDLADIVSVSAVYRF